MYLLLRLLRLSFLLPTECRPDRLPIPKGADPRTRRTKGGPDPKPSRPRPTEESPKIRRHGSDQPLMTDSLSEGFTPLVDTAAYCHWTIGLMDEGLMPLDNYDTEAVCSRPFP